MKLVLSVVNCVLAATILCCNVTELQAGVVTNYEVDTNCARDIVVYELRITDCTEIPCTIRRGKRYTIEGDIGVLRNVTNPVLKCSSVYLGRHIDLPGHGGCPNLTNGTCPMVVGERYTTATSFKLPYYVPPMLYTAYCSMVDDDGENMICGWGSGRVV
ncbi:unnamed protein product [Orchesella dallaii]|uniref:MD-2-related lipid-recognition domain-containing protein n=1 Tax=Orchesella dallaii TaxID=48710 RepID=A0ABP1PVJ0_9HEXA